MALPVSEIASAPRARVGDGGGRAGGDDTVTTWAAER